MHSLFSQVTVTKVTVTSVRDRMRVYISSEKLIHKQYVYAVEQAIREQFFSGENIEVKLLEKFHLSRQYTAEKLMPIYRDSILMELKDYSIFEYNMFRQAVCEFVDGDSMNMTVERTVVAEDKADELVRVLEKIFCERCGLSLKIHMILKEPEESKARRNSELRVEQEVRAIQEQVSSGGAENMPEEHAEPEKAKPEEKKKTEKKEAGKKQAAVSGKEPSRKSGFQEKRGGFSREGGYRNSSVKRSDNPDVVYGRDFEEDAIAIEQIQSEMGEVVVRGQIQALDTREIRNEKTIIIIEITDYTDTIVVKMFARNEQVPEILENVKKGAFLKMKGVTTIDRFDGQLTIGSVVGIKKIPDFRKGRQDTSPEKRVELHCHTKMSDMDGVSDVKDIVKRAMEWGHKAIAITDHGVVQSFPEANHAVPKDSDFKVIYGVEAYLVDDLKDMVVNSHAQNLDDTYIVFDLETTGFSPSVNRIIEIGAVKVESGKITERFSTFVNPDVPIPFRIEELTGINDNMVLDAPQIDEVLPEFLEFCGDAVMVAHNASFDMSFIEENCRRLGIQREFTSVDTVALARVLLPQLGRFKLDTVAKALHVPLHNHHRAVDDAGCTAEIFVKFVEMLKARDAFQLDDVNKLGRNSKEQVKKLPSHHAIILAMNDTGRVNLYRLVSLSHIEYYQRRPLIPKSVFLENREGLLIGSACEAGELYQAILNGRSDQEIARLVDFYDYLEIQPLGNNKFMIASDKIENVTSGEDLIEINKKIVKLGEQFGKMVVGTCDVHFLNPEDEVYRRIIMAGKGFTDADDQAPLYLRTTEEMLAEFAYLGSEKAEEIVITNPNKIADMCEKISPVRPDKCPPVIPDSDKDLRRICYNRAHEIYGDELPEIVTERL